MANPVFDIIGVMEISDTNLNLKYENAKALILTNLFAGMEKGNSRKKYNLIIKNLAAIEKKLIPKAQTWDTVMYDVVFDFFAGKIISFAAKKLFQPAVKRGVSDYVGKRFRANNIIQESLISEMLGNNPDRSKNGMLLKMINDIYNGSFSESAIDNHDFLEEFIGEGFDKLYKKTKTEITVARSASEWSESAFTATLFKKFDDFLVFLEAKMQELMLQQNEDFRKLPTKFEKARKFLIAHNQSILVATNRKTGDEFFSEILDDYINSYFTGTVVVSAEVVLPLPDKREYWNIDLLNSPYYCNKKNIFKEKTKFLGVITTNNFKIIHKKFFNFIFDSVFESEWGHKKPSLGYAFKVKDKYKKYVNLDGYRKKIDTSRSKCVFGWVVNTVNVKLTDRQGKVCSKVATVLSATLTFNDNILPLIYNKCQVPSDEYKEEVTGSILRSYVFLNYINNPVIQEMALERSFEKHMYGHNLIENISPWGPIDWKKPSPCDEKVL